MIKSLVAGIWTILLLSGSLYFFNGENKTSDEALDKGSKFLGKLEVVKLDPMSITIIRDNTLQGYVILDVSFTVQSAKIAQLSVPAEMIIKDAVNNSVFGNNDIDINNLERFDFTKFKNKMMSEISNKFGEDLINDVLIERIDFISGDSIRDKKLRGG